MKGYLRAACATLLMSIAMCQVPRAMADEPMPALRGWTAEFTWSPEFCHASPASREPQCTGEHYFVMGGLRPDFAVPSTGDCPDGASLDRDKAEALIWIVPNRHTLKRIWGEQGRCSGLELDEYFRQVERARRRVILPSQYSGLTSNLVTRGEDVRKTFVAANPDLIEQAVSLRCKSSQWLSEVRVCFDAKFAFRSCSGIAPIANCEAAIKLRGIRASRVGR
ncbi:MAG: hypothetical protein ACT4QA_14280 [Panacagrimonas sp.]